MEQQIFSDGIGQVTIIGGAVRLDLITFSPTEKDSNGQPVAVFCQRVVMSLDGFMQSAAKIQEAAHAVSQLVQRNRTGKQADPVFAPASASPAGATASEAMEPQKRPFP